MDEHLETKDTYVKDDVGGRVFTWGLLGFAAFMVASFIMVYWVFDTLRDFKTSRQGALVTSVPTGDRLPEGPLLQEDPVADMDLLRAAQNQKLNSYGWLDKEHGAVHIPIDKAVELTLERSLVHGQPAAQHADGDLEH